jgi:predicted permease
VQVSFRGNLAFVGLPVIVYALAGISSGDAAYAETQAVLVLAPALPINSSLAVVVLLISQHKFSWAAVKPVLVSLISNPLLISIVLGGFTSILKVPVPDVIMRSCEVVGQMALPLALITIGGALASIRLTGSISRAFIASVLKLLAAPAIGYLAAGFLQLPPEQSKIALIYLACPTAALSYVLTNQIGGDDALAASTVVISTILSVFSLGAVLYF